MSEELLPLFPLQVVLFPGSFLPLHIFEERYKQLINECLDGKKEFGINMVRENENLARVGCTAVVTRLIKRYPDGTMDIAVEGRRRYAFSGYAPSPALYSIGRVEFLPTKEEPVDIALAEETLSLHNELVEIVYRGNDYKLTVATIGPRPSFRIAQKAGMDLVQRQAILELESENERLNLLHGYFINTIPKLKRLGEVERVIKGDGYLVQ